MRIVPADPQGSPLPCWVRTSEPKSEGSSITGGIGPTRTFASRADAPFDDAAAHDDPIFRTMVCRLLRDEGFFIGGSSGIKLAAAVEVVRQFCPGHMIVALLCDRGGLHARRLFNAESPRETELLPH